MRVSVSEGENENDSECERVSGVSSEGERVSISVKVGMHAKSTESARVELS